MTETNSGTSGGRDTPAASPDDQRTTPAGANGGSSNGGSNAQPGADVIRLKYGYNIVIGGVVAVIALYIATILTFAILTPDNLANNVVACMGAVTGVIGSLVAAFFGVQLGASGKEASDASAAQSSALAQGAMSQLGPGQTDDAIHAAERITSLQTGSSQ